MMFYLLVIIFISSVIFALVSSSPVLVSQKDNLDKEDSLTELVKIINGSLCQNESARFQLACNNSTNEVIHIKKVILTNGENCKKSFLPSIIVSQLCNNEKKCDLNVDQDFDTICSISNDVVCQSEKRLTLYYHCKEETKKIRSKRQYTEKTKDLINRASRTLANNLGRMPLRLHYDAFYDPLYYEEEYFMPYYYYGDISRPEHRFGLYN